MMHRDASSDASSKVELVLLMETLSPPTTTITTFWVFIMHQSLTLRAFYFSKQPYEVRVTIMLFYSK